MGISAERLAEQLSCLADKDADLARVYEQLGCPGATAPATRFCNALSSDRVSAGFNRFGCGDLGTVHRPLW